MPEVIQSMQIMGDFFKEGISQMLKAEMTDHLGYKKNAKEGNNCGISHNSDYPKTLKTNLGEIHLKFYIL